MKTETVEISSVKPLDKNPRRHPERQLNELVKSVEQFGQYRPLVVDEDGKILAGNGLYTALSRSGVEKVSIYRMTGLSEGQKTKLILADNRTGDLSNDDFDVVEELLRELEDYEVPGYDPDSLRDLVLSSEEALEAAREYGKINDDDRELLNARRDQADADHEEAQTTVGNPPPPAEEEPDGFEIDLSTGSPAGDALADAVETRKSSGQVCPACGRGW